MCTMSFGKKCEEKEEKFDAFADTFCDEADQDDIKPYCEKKKPNLRSINSPLKFFERSLSQEPRGR